MKRSLYTWILMGAMVLGGAPIGPAFAERVTPDPVAGVIQNFSPTSINPTFQDVQAAAGRGMIIGCGVGFLGLLAIGVVANELRRVPERLSSEIVKGTFALGCGGGGLIGLGVELDSLKPAAASPSVTREVRPPAQVQRVPATQSPGVSTEVGADKLD